MPFRIKQSFQACTKDVQWRSTNWCLLKENKTYKSYRKLQCWLSSPPFSHPSNQSGQWLCPPWVSLGWPLIPVREKQWRWRIFSSPSDSHEILSLIWSHLICEMIRNHWCESHWLLTEALTFLIMLGLSCNWSTHGEMIIPFLLTLNISLAGMMYICFVHLSSSRLNSLQVSIAILTYVYHGYYSFHSNMPGSVWLRTSFLEQDRKFVCPRLLVHPSSTLHWPTKSSAAAVSSCI